MYYVLLDVVFFQAYTHSLVLLLRPGSLMLQLAEKERRNTCFMDMDCKDSDEDCQRLCRFRSCEREEDSLCDLIPEKLCRTNCIIKSKCKEDDEHCIKVSIFADSFLVFHIIYCA